MSLSVYAGIKKKHHPQADSAFYRPLTSRERLLQMAVAFGICGDGTFGAWLRSRPVVAHLRRGIVETCRHHYSDDVYIISQVTSSVKRADG